MEVGLILGLLKVAIETFKDERKMHYTKLRNKLEKDWQDEMALPDNERSDLTLDNILLECNRLSSLVLSELSGKN